MHDVIFVFLFFITVIRRVILLSCWGGLISGYACSTDQNSKVDSQRVTPPGEKGTEIPTYRVGTTTHFFTKDSTKVEMNILFYEQKKNESVNIWVQFKEKKEQSKWIRLIKKGKPDTSVVTFRKQDQADLTFCLALVNENHPLEVDNKKGATYAASQWVSLSSLYGCAQKGQAVEAEIKDRKIQWLKRRYMSAYRAKGKYIAWKHWGWNFILHQWKKMNLLSFFALLFYLGYWKKLECDMGDFNTFLEKALPYVLLEQFCVAYVLGYIESVCFHTFFN